MTEPRPPPTEPPNVPPPPPAGSPGPPPYPAWSPPAPPTSVGVIIGGVFAGLGASVAAPLLSLLMFNQLSTNVAIKLFGIPVLVLGLGIYLAVRASTRPFGMAFLISFALGFIVLAGTCVALLNSSLGG